MFRVTERSCRTFVPRQVGCGFLERFPVDRSAVNVLVETAFETSHKAIEGCSMTPHRRLRARSRDPGSHVGTTLLAVRRFAAVTGTCSGTDPVTYFSKREAVTFHEGRVRAVSSTRTAISQRKLSQLVQMELLVASFPRAAECTDVDVRRSSCCLFSLWN